MLRSSRSLALALPLAVLLGLSARAAGADGPPQPAAGTPSPATTATIEVPVLVLEDGKPVRGLTRDDFTVEDGRSSQTLTGFEVLDLQSPQGRETPVAQVPAAARRHFLLLFDLAFSEPASVVRARDAARRLLAGALHPTDLVAVATYSLAGGPRLVLGFTSDRRQAGAALDTLGLPQLARGRLDPLGLLLAGPPGEARPPGAEALAAAIASSREVKENPADLNRERNRIAAFTRAVADLARLLGSAEGRKDVVLFSAGFDSSRLLGRVTDVRIKPPAPERYGGGSLTIESSERPGFTRSTSELVRMLEELRRADCTVQAVDIGAQGPKGQDGLAVLAEGTGGEVYRGFDDLAQAMGDLLARTSVTYVLSFQPGDLAPDGKYHRLEVRLKDERGDRQGRRVIHRPGYYAPLPWDEQNGLERQLAGASRMLGGEQGALPVSLLAVPFPLAGQKAYVPLLVEIDGAAISGVSGSAARAGSGGPGDLQAEILAYAFDARGGIRDHFSQTLGLDLGKVGPTLRQGGLKVYGHLDLDPGDYVVRVLVREGQGSHGVATARVSVPRPDAAAAALLPPLVPDPPAPNRWLMVREPEERSKLRQVPYPFMLRQQPFVPAARPVLPSGGEVRLSLVGWGLGGDPLGAEARLYGPDGTPRPGGEIRIRERMPAGVAGSDQIVATFRPGGVAAGPYTLVVTLTDPDSGRKQSSSIPVTVAAEGTALVP